LLALNGAGGGARLCLKSCQQPCHRLKKRADEPYKPDSVAPDWSELTIIPLGRNSHYGSSSLPEGCSHSRLAPLLRKRCKIVLASLTSRAGSPLLFGLAPRGVFRASPVARRAVGSYPTFSPLPAKALLSDDEQVSLPPVTAALFRGGLFSVALSVNRSLSHRKVAAGKTVPLALPGALPIPLLTQVGVRTFLPSR
jgi:hypothetical protein